MKIIIGYDGSEYADDALEDLENAGLPESVDAVVMCGADVFHVFEGAEGAGFSSKMIIEAAARWRANVDAAIAEARQTAERGAMQLRRLFPKWTITAAGVADSPSWALIQSGEGLGDPTRAAHMIVVGAAGHSAVGRIMFGSVANQVLSNAGCQVRIGRRSSRGPDEPIRVLIGVDGSPESRLAVDEVAFRAWPKGTECRVVAVVDSRLSTAHPSLFPFGALTPDAVALAIVGESRKILEETGLTTTTAVRMGRAAKYMLKEAAEFGAHCIFLGARGLGRRDRFLLGSVSRSVAMHATCSVEVVRSGSAS